MPAPLSRRCLVASALLAIASGAVCAGEITLFEDEDFRGNSVRISSEVPSLDATGMNDKAQSAIVRDGTWELCRDAYFNGGCIQLQPGRYARMDGNFVRNVSSVREVGPPLRQAAPGTPYTSRPAPVGGIGSAQAVLYEGHDFGGRSFPMSRDVVQSLDKSGFNDRAGSLRVFGGYWVFCSDANFQGDCRTFGPGEYPNLPKELDRRLSSGRMISDAYPYSTPPQWNRR
jgi:Beta/Gamma crystallin